jgi:ribonuclease P protein component
VWRLSEPARFTMLSRTRHRSHRGPVRVAWVPPAAGEVAPPRVGYAVGRRVGGAVVRNRLRRRLRAIVATLGLPPGDYLVSAEAPARELAFPELRLALTAAVASLLSPTTGTPPVSGATA